MAGVRQQLLAKQLPLVLGVTYGGIGFAEKVAEAVSFARAAEVDSQLLIEVSETKTNSSRVDESLTNILLALRVENEELGHEIKAVDKESCVLIVIISSKKSG